MAPLFLIENASVETGLVVCAKKAETAQLTCRAVIHTLQKTRRHVTDGPPTLRLARSRCQGLFGTPKPCPVFPPAQSASFVLVRALPAWGGAPLGFDAPQAS